MHVGAFSVIVAPSKPLTTVLREGPSRQVRGTRLEQVLSDFFKKILKSTHRMWMNRCMLGPAWALCGGVLLAGCASSAGIAPQAQALQPAQLGLVADTGQTQPLAGQWWHAWGDARLNALMEQALQGQPSLKQAQARWQQALAQVSTEQSRDGLQMQATANTTTQRFSANGMYPPPLGGATETLADAQWHGRWTLDWWGKQSAALQAAVGRERASAADVQAARAELGSRVAQTYVHLARLGVQQQVAQRALAQREQMLTLIRQRVAAGLDSEVELRQGEGALPDMRLQLEQLNEQMGLARHALAALAAVPPGSYADWMPTLPAALALDVPTALPADLLGRRADVAAARWRMEAASQGVTMAQADFYPNVNLNFFAGFSSIGLDMLARSDSRQYGWGPALSLPLWDRGALRAQLKGKTAEWDAAVESYNGAVLQAVREAADQLHVLQATARQQAQQTQAQAAAEAAYALAVQRYQAGLSHYLVVLQAETAVLTQRRLAAELQAHALNAQIGLVLALGGGYVPESLPTTHPAQRSPT